MLGMLQTLGKQIEPLAEASKARDERMLAML
jgi:hypothetical protein